MLRMVVAPALTMTIMVLLVVSSCLSLVASQCASPCSWQSLRDGLMSRPFDIGVRNTTLLSLQRMATSHVFNDISMNSEVNTTLSSTLSVAGATIIPMQVDIPARLDAVANTIYATDAALQEAIADVYIPLHDAHTRYNKPPPYRFSVFTMPFQLQHRVVNNVQVVTLTMRGDWSAAYTTVYGAAPIPDGTNVDGWFVSTINNSPALDIILDFATNAIGYTKDVGSRLNLAIHGFGDGLGFYSYRSQTAFPIPSEEGLSLVLVHPSDPSVTRNVTINWLGLYRPTTLSDTQSMMNARQQRTQLDDIRAHARATGHQSGDSDDALLGAVVTSFIDSDGVLVLRIPTFGPDDYPLFIRTIEDAVAAHQLVGGTRLIIDFRNNGGGDICLGYAFIRFLFPQLTQMPGAAPSIVGRYDMAGSDLFSAFASHASDLLKRDPGAQAQCAIDPELVGYFTPCAWHDPATRRQYVNDSFMNPGRSHKRGGIAGKYTQVIQEGCEYQFNAWSPPFHRGYAADNITLVSDGLCGSTCSVVSSFIHLRGLGKTLALGGIHMKPQMFWSFPGGEVTNDTYIQSLTVKYQLPADSPLIPPPLPNNASHRFAIRELYPWTDDSTTIPMEFLHFPAHFHQPYLTNYTNTVEFYTAAKTLFDFCVDGVGDTDYPCTMKHGSGYYRCMNGVRSTTICRVTSCDAGYYLQNQANQFCTACDAGTYRSDGSAITTCNVCTNAPVSPVLPSHCNMVYVTADNGTNTSEQCAYTLTCDTAALWKYIVTGAVSALLATIIACACARYVASRRQTTIDYNDMDRA